VRRDLHSEARDQISRIRIDGPQQLTDGFRLEEGAVCDVLSSERSKPREGAM